MAAQISVATAFHPPEDGNVRGGRYAMRLNAMRDPVAPTLTNVPTPSGVRGHARIAFVTFTEEEHEAGRVIFGCDEQVPSTSCWTTADKLTQDPLDLDVVHVHADRSNMPATQHTESVLADFRPCFIFACGTAGGVSGREKLRLGDLVVGDFIQYYEFAKFSSPKRKWPWFWRQTQTPVVQARHIAYDHPASLLRQSLAQYVQGKGTWKERIRTKRPANEGEDPRVVTGMILSGEKIMQAGETEYQRALLDRYDKALAVETESYGIASAVYRTRSDKQSAFRYHYNPLFLSVRGISDFVDAEGAQTERGQWTNYAAQAACAFALAISERLIATLER